MSIFLDDADLVRLTGFKAHGKQIEHLRRTNVPFRINALGRPVVAVAVIEGNARPVGMAKREKIVPLLFRAG